MFYLIWWMDGMWWDWISFVSLGFLHTLWVYKAEWHGPVQKSGPICVILTSTLIWTDPRISYFIIHFNKKFKYLKNTLANTLKKWMRISVRMNIFKKNHPFFFLWMSWDLCKNKLIQNFEKKLLDGPVRAILLHLPLTPVFWPNAKTG